MAKKVKSDSLVSAITVDTPKVTDLNISRADLISYVTAKAQQQYEDTNRKLTHELGQAVAKYLDREIARVNKIINVIKELGEAKGITIDDIRLNHKFLIDRSRSTFITPMYDINFSITSVNNVSVYYLAHREDIIACIDINGRFEQQIPHSECNITLKNTIFARIDFKNPTAEEISNFARLNALIEENRIALGKVNDKSTKNSIISNMLEGSEKGKQMKESLHAIATSIRSELSESLKLLK